ncbi:flagellar hook protein FlgE [Aestuariispira insulae]|uniref:Flagellar hook protein FlgE n=1 Tax=Aestuariispira insulae TaxID=1461337 RepID=A0A3D9HSF4_9PROT|nr:flagellar hook protein FlgE [Aestuariispira insulae]RED52427.1 flagellar hook protein FlgE [Aestuariispira insulae]
MSLYGALRSGVSGLFAQSQSMAMISDNIANVNTNGYKVSKPRFTTLVTTAASNTQFSSGGVQSVVGRDYDQQGLLQASSVSTDVAISGNGFFTVTDQLTFNSSTGNYDISGDVFYTRAGQFRPDEDGNLVNAAGYYLTGWPRNAANTGYSTTNVQSAFNGINVAATTAAPVPTLNIDLNANLNSGAATNDTFDVPLQVFDRLGTLKTLTITFTKNATANVWDITAALAGGGQFIDPDTDNNSDATMDEGAGAAADDLLIDTTELSTITGTAGTWTGTFGDAALNGTTSNLGSITFNADGSLSSVDSDLDAGGTDIGFDNSGTTMQILIDHDASTTTAADITAININMGTANQRDGITQNAGTSSLNSFTQDGQAFGTLSGVTINDNGEVTALFDNGSTRQLYQVPITTFNNANGLTQKTGNVFIETDASGTAIAHVANTGGAGLISPSSLEASTVDLAGEFTDMITTQRAYSASTKIISTADEMLEELIRTKR